LQRLQEKQKREAEQSGIAHDDGDYVVLGNGFGNSKKSAKLESAKRALELLIPGVEFDESGIATTSADNAEADEDAVALFDMLPLDDSRVSELSAKAGQPPPYHILQECLKRNAAYANTEITWGNTRVKHHKHMFNMSVGKHSVSVVCANKREGKQKASQAMLQKLHPQIDTWGSLIRLYGHAAQRKLHETRKKRESIIKLQGTKLTGNELSSSTTGVEPNLAILDKLRSEIDVLFANRGQTTGTSRLPTTASIDL